MILPEHHEAARAGWVQRDLRPIWQVADNRYGMDRTRGHGERWQLSRSPWAKQILEDCQNPHIREVVLMAGSQCAKTAPMLICMAWGCANEPGPTLWITGNDDLAKDASQERIQPTLERCPDTRGLLQNNRLDKTTWKVRMTTMTLDIAGAQASAVLEQNPYVRIFGDEVRQWPLGSLQKVEKRQRSFTNAKRYLFSTPNMKGDEFHQRFLAGTRCEWVWPCMECGFEQQLTWKGLQYGSDISSDAVREEVDTAGGEHRGVQQQHLHDAHHHQLGCCIVCSQCGRKHYDQPAIRRHICDLGRWISRNEQAQPGVVSYHWNALLPPWVSWGDLVKEWKQANELKKQGNVEPLKVFVCETLGEPWEDRAEESTSTKLRGRIVQGYHLGTKAEEGVSFGTVDVQQDVVFWTVRNWTPGGKSLLVAYGKSFGLGDIQRDIVEPYLIGPQVVAIDCGYTPEEVFRHCRQYGYKAFRGDKSTYYVVENVRQVWRTKLQGAPPLPVTWFSSAGVKDILSSYMTGQAGEWKMPEDVGHDYIDQLLSEAKTPKLNKDKIPTGEYEWRQLSRNNHWLDCECMQIVAALDFSLWAVKSNRQPLIGGITAAP